MKKLLSGVAFAALLTPLVAGAQKKCGHEYLMDKIYADPGMRATYEQHKKLAILKDEAAAKSTQSTAAYEIPVVVHIVLNQSQINSIGGTQGILKRIDSQLVVLNRDFQKMNGDSTRIPAVFKPLYGNANILFSLAHRKPNGTSTPGYEIITTSQSAFNGLGGTIGSQFACSNVKYTATGGAAAWNTAKYLNIWVCNFTDNQLLGIAFPKYLVTDFFLPAEEMGVVINYQAFGKRTIPTVTNDPYISGIDKGRTTTHEIGHFLGLEHIWGEQPNCSDDDGINDTPQQDDANGGCPGQNTVYANCTSSAGGEMWMNYMDYVDDGCMVMFSKGQVTRMHTTYPSTLTPDPSIFQWPTELLSVELENQFDVYPNPTNGKININFATAPGTLQRIEVTNVMGQKVYEQNATPNTAIYNIDISDKSKGIYFVQCQFSEGKVTRKIVVE
ncbi:MAG: T9SS type A sorting domain-containing protein [Flavipsychrobacter sp.]|nr:T9SS type A sorting domain-containing protein [Flavipsychrobacter sp.]